MFSKVCLKHGERPVTWANKLTVAIATQNTKQIEELTHTLPEFSNLEEMQEALYLIKEAYSVMQKLKDETARQLQQIKKNIDFLESTSPRQKNRLDVSY